MANPLKLECKKDELVTSFGSVWNIYNVDFQTEFRVPETSGGYRNKVWFGASFNHL